MQEGVIFILEKTLKVFLFSWKVMIFKSFSFKPIEKQRSVKLSTETGKFGSIIHPKDLIFLGLILSCFDS